MIGAGLFVGSGAVMNQTGPAAVVSYLPAPAPVVLIMRMLGEMAGANPATNPSARWPRHRERASVRGTQPSRT